ncbi:SDR family oxidoreductase [Paraglaciecola sp. 2405UD69-4]|uniref:SDR family oxidoreductase n=1 Tax=Paraglaciecola sp. 2405UD69-4 TaxID=3391836 RepID=UPI0039C9F7FE
MTIKDKPWALITGANGGIGKALVDEFVGNGYRVIATDISHRTNITNEEVIFLQIDLQKIVSDEIYASDFLAQVTEISNGVGISALINNAAIQILSDCQTISRSQWQNSFDVNLSAPFFMVQTFLDDLIKNAGAVVNMSSIHATQTKKSFVAYATTKAGLSSLTRNLAIDLGSTVRVNAIEPAAVGTDMLKAGFAGNVQGYKALELFHPIARIASPKEVAELALFLCSDKANFVHGACISASGGIQGCLSDPG